MELNDKEKLRYSRHLLLKEVGEQGQKALKAAHVAVVGCGGLGSPALFYLAASGVGSLTFVDNDAIELSNLQRQILYKINHIGQAKVNAANKVLGSLNNQIQLYPKKAVLNLENAASILDHADIVLDCSDNFATRYVLNEYCQKYKKVLISGAAMGVTGQLMLFDFRQLSPCYGCLFPKNEEATALNCDNFGVVSPLLGVIGSMQAMLTINTILGYVDGSLFKQISALTLQQSSFAITRDPTCSICSS